MEDCLVDLEGGDVVALRAVSAFTGYSQRRSSGEMGVMLLVFTKLLDNFFKLEAMLSLSLSLLSVGHVCASCAA